MKFGGCRAALVGQETHLRPRRAWMLLADPTIRAPSGSSRYRVRVGRSRLMNENAHLVSNYLAGSNLHRDRDVRAAECNRAKHTMPPTLAALVCGGWAILIAESLD